MIVVISSLDYWPTVQHERVRGDNGKIPKANLENLHTKSPPTRLASAEKFATTRPRVASASPLPR